MILTCTMKRKAITEIQVRRIVQQELYYRSILEEGIWDDVKTGAKKLIVATTKQVAGSGLVDKAKQAIGSMTQMPDGVKQVMDILKKAMAETGEQVSLDKTLQDAKAIGQLNANTMGAMLAADLKGPVHAKAAKLSETAFRAGLDPHLNELSVGFNEVIQNKQTLNEAGLLGIFGLSLAGFGGTIFALRGLEKLAHWLGAEKTAAVIHKVHHTLHHLEEKMISKIIPDQLSFVVYKLMTAKGLRFQQKEKKPLDFDSYKAGHLGVKNKVEKLIYSVLLIFLAWNGIKAALHAGVSLLGFAEGTASVIKGAEIAQASAHIGDIIELGFEVEEDLAG